VFRIITYFFTVVPITIASAAETQTSAPAYKPPGTESGYRSFPYADTNLYNRSGDGIAVPGAKNIPVACYVEKVKKTFFVYAGYQKDTISPDNKATGRALISYYDHNTGMLPRPTVLVEGKANTQIFSPAITADNDGHLWVFVGSNTKDQQACIFKSYKPYAIESFELVKKTDFSNPQCWHIPNKGLILIYTLNQDKCRQLYCTTSADGLNFSNPQLLAAVDKGHDAVSWKHKNKIAVAFNVYPDNNQLKHPSNIYYMETSDFAKSWRNARKEKMNLPLTTAGNPALVREYSSQKWIIMLQDLTIDQFGFPTILCMLSRDPSPESNKSINFWNTARWYGRDWEISGQIRSDSKFDLGCLHVEKNRSWRLVGPTGTGPQANKPGGDIVAWRSEDQGRSWYKDQLTENSKSNHNYARKPLDAHEGFDTFWSDAATEKQPWSRLYFADKAGNVFVMPEKMTGNFEKPLQIRQAPKQEEEKEQ